MFLGMRRTILFILIILTSLIFIQDNTILNVEAGTVTMTDKKAYWEGTHNMTMVLQFNATDADHGHSLTWWIHTNLTCLSLEQNADGSSAWINGTPDYNETDQWYSVYIGVMDDYGYSDTNEFIMYINNSAPILYNLMHDIIISEGTEINHQYGCIDQNQDHVNFTVHGDDHLIINETGHLHGTPSNHNGDVVVVVSDGMGDDSDSFSVTVTGGGGGEEVSGGFVPIWFIVLIIIIILIYLLFRRF
jgi:hypothetical protein